MLEEQYKKYANLQHALVMTKKKDYLALVPFSMILQTIAKLKAGVALFGSIHEEYFDSKGELLRSKSQSLIGKIINNIEWEKQSPPT